MGAVHRLAERQARRHVGQLLIVPGPDVRKQRQYSLLADPLPFLGGQGLGLPLDPEELLDHRHRELASEKVRRVIEQCARWGAVVGLRGQVQPQVLQYLLDHLRVLNGGNDMTGLAHQPAATFLALLDVDGENELESLCGEATAQVIE